MQPSQCKDVIYRMTSKLVDLIKRVSLTVQLFKVIQLQILLGRSIIALGVQIPPPGYYAHS